MVKCESCGSFIHEEELIEVKEAVGEAWGHTEYQFTNKCPCCGSTDLEYDADEEWLNEE